VPSQSDAVIALVNSVSVPVPPLHVDAEGVLQVTRERHADLLVGAGGRCGQAAILALSQSRQERTDEIHHCGQARAQHVVRGGPA
jgi:hypothetical protein